MCTTLTLTFNLDSQDTIKVPCTMIKSPGMLLEKVKTETSPPNGSPISSHNSSPLLTTRSAERQASQMVYPSVANAGRGSHRAIDPVKRYLNVFAQYNIEFETTLDSEISLLGMERIAKELCRLPQSFVVKLQLKIIFTNRPDFGNERYSISSLEIEDANRLPEKLYGMMFDCFLEQFPSMLLFWPENEISEGTPKSHRKMTEEMQRNMDFDKAREIEKAFLAVMLNKDFPRSQLHVIKVKELLMRFDSKAFSADWFKNHNNKLKKGLKVSFSNVVEESSYSN